MNGACSKVFSRPPSLARDHHPAGWLDSGAQGVAPVCGLELRPRTHPGPPVWPVMPEPLGCCVLLGLMALGGLGGCRPEPGSAREARTGLGYTHLQHLGVFVFGRGPVHVGKPRLAGVGLV